jgi:tripartite-type tricarboxylate transporter receptor subunit TctC
MIMLSRRNILRVFGAMVASTILPGVVHAQQWPSKPVRAIVPFSPGSTTDIIGRIVLDAMSSAIGQPIVVENRGGAGGTIGTALVSRAEPDGYTVLVHAAAHSAAPAAYPNAPYQAGRDLAGVGLFGVVPNVIVVAPSRGFKNLADLVKAAEKGSMTFSSAGVGSATHWAAERFRLSAGFKAVHVPFKGGPEALTDVATGRVDFMCSGVTSALPFIRSGRLIPLAVSTRQRSSLLPDVPTTIEAGYADSDYTFWNGLLVPAKTPRNIVDRLHAEMQTALKQTSVVDKLKSQGIEFMNLSPSEMDAMIRKEIQNNLAIVKAAGLKFN